MSLSSQMIIGVPKEIKAAGASRRPRSRYRDHPDAPRPHRAGAEKRGRRLRILRTRITSRSGAKIIDTAEELFRQAEMIVKVKEPLPAEYGLLRKGQILFTYLHLAASKPLTEALLKSGVTGVAYETIQVGNKLPLLEPMSEIAGRMSVVMGAYYLAKHNGGNGVLLGGVPGVLPGHVVVIGGGTSGVNAARMAVGLKADVTILEVDGERMRFLDLTMPNVNTLYSNEANLTELMPTTDLLDRRGAGAGRKGAQADHARDVAKNETGQRVRGHRDRPGRLRGDLARDHAS